MQRPQDSRTEPLSFRTSLQVKSGIVLSERASVPFAKLLINPLCPNRKAIAAAKRYKEQFLRD